MDLRHGLRFPPRVAQPHPRGGDIALNGSTRLAILADLVRETPKNFAMMVPLVRAWRSRFPRGAKGFAEITESDLTRHAFAALDLLWELIPPAGFAGTSVIEIGPGDNVVLGLPLMALGASAYHAVDRFMGDVYSRNAVRLYERVVDELPKRYAIPGTALPDPRSYPHAHEGTTVFLHRKGIEDYPSFDLDGRADLVFSHGVGGQVACARTFCRACYDLLKPGGVALHRVYFGPAGSWVRYRNPLTFLSLGDFSWRLASSHRGVSNRVRFHDFVKMFEDCGFQVATRVTAAFSEEDVEEIRPRLSKLFKDLPTDSLRISEADFLCLKRD